MPGSQKKQARHSISSHYLISCRCSRKGSKLPEEKGNEKTWLAEWVEQLSYLQQSPGWAKAPLALFRESSKVKFTVSHTGCSFWAKWIPIWLKGEKISCHLQTVKSWKVPGCHLAQIHHCVAAGDESRAQRGYVSCPSPQDKKRGGIPTRSAQFRSFLLFLPVLKHLPLHWSLSSRVGSVFSKLIVFSFEDNKVAYQDLPDRASLVENVASSFPCRERNFPQGKWILLTFLFLCLWRHEVTLNNLQAWKWH